MPVSRSAITCVIRTAGPTRSPGSRPLGCPRVVAEAELVAPLGLARHTSPGVGYALGVRSSGGARRAPASASRPARRTLPDLFAMKATPDTCSDWRSGQATPVRIGSRALRGHLPTTYWPACLAGDDGRKRHRAVGHAPITDEVEATRRPCSPPPGRRSHQRLHADIGRPDRRLGPRHRRARLPRFRRQRGAVPRRVRRGGGRGGRQVRSAPAIRTAGRSADPGRLQRLSDLHSDPEVKRITLIDGPRRTRSRSRSGRRPGGAAHASAVVHRRGDRSGRDHSISIPTFLADVVGRLALLGGLLIARAGDPRRDQSGARAGASRRCCEELAPGEKR